MKSSPWKPTQFLFNQNTPKNCHEKQLSISCNPLSNLHHTYLAYLTPKAPCLSHICLPIPNVADILNKKGASIAKNKDQIKQECYNQGNPHMTLVSFPTTSLSLLVHKITNLPLNHTRNQITPGSQSHHESKPSRSEHMHIIPKPPINQKKKVRTENGITLSTKAQTFSHTTSQRSNFQSFIRKRIAFWGCPVGGNGDLTTGFLSLRREGLSRSSLWSPTRSPERAQPWIVAGLAGLERWSWDLLFMLMLNSIPKEGREKKKNGIKIEERKKEKVFVLGCGVNLFSAKYSPQSLAFRIPRVLLLRLLDSLPLFPPLSFCLPFSFSYSIFNRNLLRFFKVFFL